MATAGALVAMPDPETVARFLARCEPHVASACVLYLGAVDQKGYGNVRAPGLSPSGFVKAHRLSYRVVRGPIPAGMTLDHVCETAACVNPYHLELVTLVENVRRRNGPDRYAGG